MVYSDVKMNAAFIIKVIVLTCGGISTLLGLAVLTGWHTGNEWLIQVHTFFVPMQYNTALGFLCCGIGILGHHYHLKFFGALSGSIAGLIGLLSLFEYVAQADIGLDALFMKNYMTVETPGRMAPNTALSFFLSSVGLWLLYGQVRHKQAGGVMGSLVFGLGLTALVGYLVGYETASGWGNLTHMPLHTAAGFMVVSLGITTLSWLKTNQRQRKLKTKDRPVLMGYAAALAATIFFIDLHLPLGIAAGFPYILLVLVGWFMPQKKDVIIFASAATVLIVFGYFLSPQSNSELWVVHTNRSFAIIAIWITAILIYDIKAKDKALRAGNLELEKKVKQRTAAFSESEKKYRLLYDNSPDMFVSVEPQQAIVKNCNQTVAAKLGYSTDEIIGKPVFNLYHPDCLDQVKTAFQSFMDTGKIDNTELLLKKKDGNTLDVILQATAIMDEDGSIVTSNSSWRDISDLKKAEKRFQALLESAPDAMVIVNSEGKLQLVNDQFEKVFGYSRQEILGKKVEVLMPERFHQSHNLFRSDYFKSPEIRPMGKEVNLFGIRKNGEEFPVEISISPIETESGMVVCAVVRDITERKNAENKLKKSEAFKQKVLDLSPSGIYIYDQDLGYNVYTNTQYTELTGYTLEDINAMSQEEFFALFHPEDQPKIAEHMGELATAKYGEIFKIEYRFKTADGRWIWCLSWDAVFERDQQEKPRQFMGAFMDITDQKEAQQALKQSNRKLEIANKELKDFAYIASHDLQEPLRVISSFLELLKKRYGEKLEEKGKEYIERTVNASNRMKVLINDLLEFSRVDSRGGKFVDTDMVQIVEEVKEDLHLMMVESGATVSFEKLPKILADPTQMKQLMQNLIENAIKFRQKDQRPIVNISAKKQGNLIKFTVQDNGIGIEKEFHDRIFTVFQRLHSREHYKGTGIGLAICKKIVERHGGSIWVESEPGKGSNFNFNLPINQNL